MTSQVFAPRKVSVPRDSNAFRSNLCAFSAVRDVSKDVVKVCGIVSPEDAEFAASQGADLIGMILWPKAARSVSIERAKCIASSIRQYGAQAVAVFVDEDAPTIAQVCKDCGVSIAQLHGDKARESLSELPSDIRVIYVVHADSDGIVQTKLPEAERKPDWFLVDSLRGGSGMKFDWNNLKPPSGAVHGWILAGGLTDTNVGEAIRTASPNGVDVSSGVCDQTGLSKDLDKVKNYIHYAKESFG